MSQPEIDPALTEHLRELAAFLREIGAAEIIALRSVADARLSFTLPALEAEFQAAGISATLSGGLPVADGGLLLLIHFPHSDGGPPGTERL